LNHYAKLDKIKININNKNRGAQMRKTSNFFLGTGVGVLAVTTLFTGFGPDSFEVTRKANTTDGYVLTLVAICLILGLAFSYVSMGTTEEN